MPVWALAELNELARTLRSLTLAMLAETETAELFLPVTWKLTLPAWPKVDILAKVTADAVTPVDEVKPLTVEATVRASELAATETELVPL